MLSPLWMVAALTLHAGPEVAPPFALEQNVRVELWVTVPSGVLWLLSESVLKSALAPRSCSWCDRTLNPVDAWGRGIRAPTPHQGTPDTLSSLVDYGLLPLGLAGMEWLMVARTHGGSAWSTDTLDILEAVLATSILNELVKDASGRARPFVRALPASERGLTPHPADNNVSFFSGHTSLAFSLVAATATVAELRGYHEWYWIWLAGLPVAAAVGVLRMAADKHYLTDVVVGAAVGTGIGMGLPRLLHPRKLPGNVTLRLSAGPGMAALTGSF